MATLVGIALRNKPKAVMLESRGLDVTPERGIEGDCRGRPGKRQVTVLSLQSWQAACAEVNADLHWTTRRANLLVEGLTFGPESVGKVIHIGELQLLITRETDPCRRMDQAHPGLKRALLPEWRGGVCCRVVNGGRIAVGSHVEIIDE
ncbi:MAG TPA: molybdenum cofactor biosysynthesis protein [Porticoccaceae bacterium]|nr:molybdenum cofactor biosysynthesis protein [Porticoccaceae bacterium]